MLFRSGAEPGLVRGRSLRGAGPRPLCSCGGGRRCGLEVRAREPRRGERVAPGLSAGSAPPPDGSRGRAGPAPGVLRRPRVSPPPAAREHVTSSRRSLRPQRPRPRLSQPQPQPPPPPGALVPRPPPLIDAGPGVGAPWRARGTAASRWPSGRTGGGARARRTRLCLAWARGGGPGVPGSRSTRSRRPRRSGWPGWRAPRAGPAPAGISGPAGGWRWLCLGGNFGPLLGALNDQKIE